MNTLSYYNKNAKEFVSDTIDVTFTETQDVFLDYIPAGGSILDFGCGSGRDTKYFLSKGYNVDAIDGSEELCKIASEHTGISVKQMLFDELDVIEAYDGIWACASILHMEKNHLPDVINRIVTATKENGTVYLSFKYGAFEGMKNGRYFTYLTEETFQDMIKDIPTLIIDKMWISADVRPGRGDEQWLNLILKKRTLD